MVKIADYLTCFNNNPCNRTHYVTKGICIGICYVMQGYYRCTKRVLGVFYLLSFNYPTILNMFPEIISCNTLQKFHFYLIYRII